MMQQRQPDDQFKDLVSQEDPRMNMPENEEELKQFEAQISKFDRQSIVHQPHDNKIYEMLEQVNIPLDTKIVIKQSLDLFDKALNQAQDLTVLFGFEELYLIKSTQLAKLAVTGLMQISQILEVFITELKPNTGYSKNYTMTSFSVFIKDTNDINLQQVKMFLEYVNEQILVQIVETNEKFFDQTTKKIRPKTILRELKILLSKLFTLIEQFPFIIVMNKNDLFQYERSHEYWQSLYKYVEFKVFQFIQIVRQQQLDTRENLKQSYDRVLRGVLLGSAIVSKQGEYNNDFMKGMVMSFGALYYILNEKKSSERAKNFQADPQTDLALQVWNMVDNGIVKHMIPFIFPSIKYKEKIFIPRLFKRITLEYILSQYEAKTINKINENCDFIPNKPKMLTMKELFKDEKNDSRVQVRILCKHDIKQFKGDSSKEFNQFCEESLTPQSYFSTLYDGSKHYKKIDDQIIIHIHGGGFVAMSSRSHQTYTRKWANSLNVPIFSIDYRLAPQYPYPAALDDVWQAYMWIINFTPFYFNIIPKRVILVGDSAGGNLIAALTILAIKERARVPDGLLMAYPALNLDLRFFTPSFYISLDDLLLPHTFLRLCLTSYVQSEDLDPAQDPLLSPSRLSDEILEQFPVSRIVAGTNDPLHDESWRMLQKLVQEPYLLLIKSKHKKDVRMIIYEGMPHGFFSFDTIQGMKEATVTVQDATRILQELLAYPQQQKQFEEQLNDQSKQLFP